MVDMPALSTASATLKKSSPSMDMAQDESSDLHLGFHQAIIVLSASQWLATRTESSVIQLCAMRARTIGANDRVQRSSIDHMSMMTA